MNAFLEGVLNISPVLAFTIVGCLIFAEDALFIGFLIPGETARCSAAALPAAGRQRSGP